MSILNCGYVRPAFVALAFAVTAERGVAIEAQFELHAVNLYDADFNFLEPIAPFDAPHLLIEKEAPVIVEFEVTVAGVKDLEPGIVDAFGGVVFDLNAEVGVVLKTVWQPNQAFVDLANVPPLGGNNDDAPLWNVNEDANFDLVDITATIDPTTNLVGDPRSLVGQGGPTAVGTIFFRWDGVTSTTVSLDVTQVFGLNAGTDQLVDLTDSATVTNRGLVELLPHPFIGDVNRDSVVDALDIAPFIAAIANGGEYDIHADINQDRVVDALDIYVFIPQFLGPGTVAGVSVPEPSTVLLLLTTTLCFLGRMRSLPGCQGNS